MHFQASKVAAALGAAIAVLAAPPLPAQEVLEEIVVTALKRAESLQDAPATVVAFDSETVEQARIQSMRDYVNLTSNMTLMETQNNAFAFVNIRGLAQIRNVDPTVAVVIDGVLSTTSLAFSQDLYDIQQIEVLKGPQGALYGRNASGGAINITTKQPTSEPEVYVRGGIGNGDNVQLSGVASGPLGSDALLGRVVVGYKDADGWRDNVATGVKADPYEDLTVGGKLLWDLGASTALDLRLNYSNTESTGSQFVSNAPNFVTGFPGNAQYPGNGSAPASPRFARVDHGADRRSEQHEHQAPRQRTGHGRARGREPFGQDRLGGGSRHADVDHVVRHARSRDCRGAICVLPLCAGGGRARRRVTSGQRRGTGVSSGARRLRDRSKPHVRPESFPRIVQPRAADHVARRPLSALDRWRLLRANRSRRDDRDQQRLRPGVPGAAHGSEHRRHQSHGVLDTALSRAIDTDPRVPGRFGAEPEHERKRARLQLRQQPQHGVRRVRSDQLRPHRRARAVGRAALRPGPARAHDHGAKPVSASVRLPERPLWRRA